MLIWPAKIAAFSRPWILCSPTALAVNMLRETGLRRRNRAKPRVGGVSIHVTLSLSAKQFAELIYLGPGFGPAVCLGNFTFSYTAASRDLQLMDFSGMVLSQLDGFF